jgi:aspartate kinase
MDTLVMKFGGSTVGTTTALSQVLGIVLHERERWNRLVLVVSALDGVTDSLIEAAHFAQLGNQRGYRRIVANLRTRHMALIEELPMGPTDRTALQTDIDRQFFDLLDGYQGINNAPSGKSMTDAFDATIGIGEKLSARIIAALLRQNHLKSVAMDTTTLVVTDEVHGNATPNIALTRQLIDSNLLPLLDLEIIPVVTGFIGATPSGKPTTLGRGGSDFTASVLGVCVSAKEIWIWTDVDGMMSADPREIPDARVIPVLSYDEVAELAYFGARVLHARMIGPLQQDHIPLRIKNVFRPQQTGTLIYDSTPDRSRSIKAVTSIPGLIVATENTNSFMPIAEMVAHVPLDALPNQVDVITSSQSSNRSQLCLLIPTTAGPEAVHTTREILEQLLRTNAVTQTWTIQPVSIITSIGASLDQWPQATARLLQALGNIRMLALAQGPSRCSLSLVLDVKDADEALSQIHQLILSSG